MEHRADNRQTTLMHLFSGWDGYNTSLIHAVQPLTGEQLAYRYAPGERSLGAVAAHVAFGRIDWFLRMGAPGAAELAERAAPLWKPWQAVDPSVETDAGAIVHWLEASWGMIEGCLTAWSVPDLDVAYRQPYGGKVYSVSRQWVIWRIMCHDIHHGGQISLMLAAQGIAAPDLGDNGGHIIAPPIVEEA